jgi:flagellar biogenesis protein FliO
LEWNLWEAVIRIIVCLPIVGLLAYLLIKFGLAKNYSRAKGNLKLLEQVVLSPKATINIVRAGDEYLLVSATEQEVTVIKQLDDYQENNVNEYQFYLSDTIKRFTRRSDSNA